MAERVESLTVTLHWLADGRGQASTVVCEDSAPSRLIPLLLAGCGLRADDERGRARPFTLRIGAADGRPMRPETPVGRQGVHNVSHLLRTDGGQAARRRCLPPLPAAS